MFLCRRSMQVEWTEHLEDGVTSEQAKKRRSIWLRVYDLLGSVSTALVLILVVFIFICRPTSVNGTSMCNTLQDGDWLITAPKNNYVYGDIVVITQPNVFNEPIIKRVIATEGQTIDIDFISGRVTVDGKELNEPYIAEKTRRSFDIPFPITVPKGCVFVMGDNRMHSTDSRSSDIGFIDTRYILGKAKFRILPFGSFNIYDYEQGEING